MLQSTLRLCALFFVIFVSHSGYANQGEAIYQQCVACHGVNAEGNTAMKSPALAGQSEAYLLRQLTHFKTGLRGKHPADIYGSQMTALVANLDDNALKEVSAYLSSLPSSVSEEQRSGDERKGYAYYQGKCGACHGGQAQGNPAFKAPRLAGLSSDYIERQMQYFREGIRGTDKTDKPGRQMAAMSRTVSDEQLHDILLFISQQD
ncbi:cytochrome C [Alteromonas sediminis]|uniref:Cytochrome C n=1 Tax=Alteromonas sediminis TaxID=2259342 RepID=A0A3N5Y2P7_9ALTE|nr:c-type cytochrome [Alteromonas sediminis]RPJ68042.1 cytochrome C [Alteromonas sediminis]